MEDKVAIIGVGCRVPGANNIDEFWNLLKNGENHVIEIPPERWNLEAFYHPDQGAPGKTYAREAGLLKDHDKWDYKIYGINEFEAKKMDPQHKYVLDCTFMGFENAGITRDMVDASRTGVYIGLMGSDYSSVFYGDYNDFDNYTLTGINNSIVSSRVSYVFNLHGPSVKLDSACSSALLAIHLACQSIRLGETDMAVAGGVNAILSPDTFIQLSKAGMVSATGQCHAFSENADGYTRGEGCGIVILKKYQQAIKDNDPIWAIIDTASNHDGSSMKPITNPSKELQKRLLQDIFDRTNTDPQTIDYIEAHGTGTKAGDPVEIAALGEFFHDPNRPKQRFVGSVKTNIGHLESAAGVAGLIKVLLMHKHQMIVPSLHFEKPSENVPLHSYHLDVPTKLYQWPQVDRDNLKSSVNSFGFGGSNCHAIITSYRSSKRSDDQIKIGDPRICCLSAHDLTSLEKMVSHFCEKSKSNEYSLNDISFTSTVRRNHYSFRFATVGYTIDEVVQKLSSTQIKINLTSIRQKKQIIFVFAGMGTNWQGMCRDLLSSNDVFRNKIEELSNLMSNYLGWNILEFFQNGFDLQDAKVSPIMTFACEVGIYHVLVEWGITPDVIVGQSIGEVAAAYASGVFSLADACYIIHHRTKLQAETTGGKMIVVKNMDIKSVSLLLEAFNNKANIAVYSSPICCTIAYDADIENLLKSKLVEHNSNAVIIDLNVTSAFHSLHMTVPAQNMSKYTDFKGGRPKTTIISTVTGHNAEDNDFNTSNYWSRNIQEPVKFYQALQETYDSDKLNIFLEIGPRPVLRAHMNDIFKNTENVVNISCMNKSDGDDCLLKAICELYQNNVNPYWQQVIDFTANVVDIPQYRFNVVSNLYIPDGFKLKLKGLDIHDSQHPFIKTSSQGEHIILLSPSRLASIYEHKLNDFITIPGALYSEIGIYLAMTECSNIPYKDISINFKRTLVLISNDSKHLNCTSTWKGSVLEFNVNDGSIIYATGTISPGIRPSATNIDIEKIKKSSDYQGTQEDLYNCLGGFGFSYGEAMTLMGNVWYSKEEALVEVNLNEVLKKEMRNTYIHPAIMDAVQQSTAAFGLIVTPDVTLLPVQSKNIQIYKEVEERMFSYIKVVDGDESKMVYQGMLLSETGEPIMKISRFTVKVIGNTANTNDNKMYKMVWEKIGELSDIPSSELIPPCHIQWASGESLQNEKNSLIIDNQLMKTVDIQSLDSYTSVNNFILVMTNDNYGKEEHIQKQITDWMLWLKGKLLHIEQICDNGHVIVIFQNLWTVQSFNGEIPVQSHNVLSSSLWGFLRSVQREIHSYSLYLIDYQGNLTDECISFIHGQIYLKYKTYGELLIDNGKVFNAQLQFYEEDANVKTSNLKSLQNGHYHLYQSNSCKNDIHVMYSDYSNLRNNPENYSELNISHIVLPHSEPDNFVFQSESSPVFSTENVGWLTKNNEKKQVVSYFPVHASNKIYVPNSSCIALSKFPNYQPGMLSLMVTLLRIAEETWNKSTIILYDDFTEETAKLMKLIQPNAQSCSFANIRKRSTLTFTHLVLLMQVTNDDILYNISQKYPDLKTIVLISNLHGNGVRQQIAMFSPCVKVIFINIVNHDEPRLLLNIDKFIKSHTTKLNELEFTADRCLKMFCTEVLEPQNLKIPLYMTNQNCICKSAIYIVVGGISGLGWQCVRWLAEKKAGIIVCFQRRCLSDEENDKLLNLSEEFSCLTISIQTDVSNYKALKQSMETLKRSYPRSPIKGIIYGAGTLKDCTLMNLTEDNINIVLTPKITGAWNMHLLTKDLDLDFFILHSSITAVFGSPGQSNYGAGNSFQDSLAHYRRSIGLPATTINWGPLDMGMLESNNKTAKLRQNMEKIGYRLIRKEGINKLLEKVVISNPTQSIIADFDHQKLRKFTVGSGIASKLKGILQLAEFDFSQRLDTSNDINLGQFKRANETDKLSMLNTYLTKLVSKVFTVDESVIDSKTKLNEAGMDSMYAMTIVNEVKKTINYRIPINILFGADTTVATISHLIIEDLTETVVTTDTTTKEFLPNDQEEISFIEYRYLKLILDPKTFKTFHFASDIHFKNISLPKALMEGLIMKILERHEITRRTYHGNISTSTSKKDIKIKIQEAKEALDFYCIEGDEHEVDRFFTDKITQSFDVSSKGPIRFIYSSKNNSIRLNIVFNHVSFDMNSAEKIIKDIINCFIHTCVNNSIEKLPQTPSTEKINVAFALDQAVNASKDKMKSFWKTQIEKGVPELSFKCNHSYSQHDSKILRVRESLSEKMLFDIKELSKVLGTTFNKIMITAFQLLLSYKSGQQRVFATLPKTLRSDIPETQQSMECLINQIPVFTDVPQDRCTIRDFIEINSSAINTFSEHGIFPFDEIVNMIPKTQNRDLYRHIINFVEQYSFAEYEQIARTYGVDVEIKESEYLYTCWESCLQVKTDRLTGNVSLDLEMPEDMFSKDEANKLMNDFISLLNFLITHPDKTIDDLKNYLKNLR